MMKKLFGKKPDDSGGPGSEPVLEPLSNEAIIAVLKSHEYRYMVDSDDDVCGRWGDEGHEIWFLRMGKAKEVLVIRYTHAIHFPPTRREALLDFCNRWNDEKLFPKSYMRVHKNGNLMLVGEFNVDLEHGVSRKQLDLMMECAISTSLRMGEACDEQMSEVEVQGAEHAERVH